LLGALRSTAQLVSYEVALGFSLIPALLLAGTLSLRGIVEAQAQQGIWYGFVQPVALFILLVAAIAETNRNPFDLPEAESELVAGFHTEFSGFRFALYFMAEYASMILVSAVAVTLFLGGWLRPLPNLPAADALKFTPVLIFLWGAGWCGNKAIRLPRGREWQWQRLVLLGLAAGALVVAAGLVVPVRVAGLLVFPVLEAVQGVFWFLAKVFLFLFAFIWFRGTFPRYRFDQLMSLGWHFMIPVAILNVICAGLAIALSPRYGWNLPLALWGATAVTLVGALLLARGWR
jgi:NADH-quinone oxidoreductase subunit H